MIENAQSGSQSLNSSNNTFYTNNYTASFSKQQVVEEEFMIGRAKQVLYLLNNTIIMKSTKVQTLGELRMRGTANGWAGLSA